MRRWKPSGRMVWTRISTPATWRTQARSPRWWRRWSPVHGGLHVLVNSAAINIVKPALDHTPEDLDALLASNVRGAFLCAQEAARAMVNRGGGGKIVLLTSMVAERAVPNQSAYIATKGAVVSLDARAGARVGAARHTGERPGAATHQNADDGRLVRQSR